MTSAVTLAGPEDADRILSLMARYHAEARLDRDDAHREATALPLLEGGPLGALWVIGPRRAPLGYVMISFGWSAADAGMRAWLEEIYIRDSVRGRGIGTETLHGITRSLAGAGVKTLNVALPDASRPAAFCKRCGFATVTDLTLLQERL